MKILVTGANGYIGTRLIPSLLEAGHEVWCMVRDARRFQGYPHHHGAVHVIQADLLAPETLKGIPKDMDIAYYLVHSMRTTSGSFDDLETQCARNFAQAIGQTETRQIIYLSGIGNDKDLSKHLKSRIQVERVLAEGPVPVTVLRAAIIIGSGSASFEILRDLVEKLPVMVTPRWVKNRIQPIAIADVIYYLQAVIMKEETFGKSLDIGGPDVLTYRQLMMLYAQVRGLRRWMISVPVLTPRLSSYWLFFITATTFSLARSLVDSLRNEVVCSDQHINVYINHKCLTCEEALLKAMARIESNEVLSSWTDSLVSGSIRNDYLDFVHVPNSGVYTDVQRQPITGEVGAVRERIFSIGGSRGWYHMNWAWKLRGYLDKALGGVGLRRGRRHPSELRIGDAVDFWRTLVTTPTKDLLVLFAEMKLPGEAWLEFRLDQDQDQTWLTQTATFRPRGVLGRLYWYALTPIHVFIFRGMAKSIAQSSQKEHLAQG